MVVIGILAILAPLTSGVLFDRISMARGFRKATGMLGGPPPTERGAHA